MFDIGFWEISVIAVVALVVIGPERLPGVARQIGMWLGRIRGFVSSVQSDINQEISKSEELKRLLAEQAKIKEFHEIIETSQEPSRMVASLGEELEHSVSGTDTGKTRTDDGAGDDAAQKQSTTAPPAGSVPRAQPVAPRVVSTGEAQPSAHANTKADVRPAPGAGDE